MSPISIYFVYHTKEHKNLNNLHGLLTLLKSKIGENKLERTNFYDSEIKKKYQMSKRLLLSLSMISYYLFS